MDVKRRERPVGLCVALSFAVGLQFAPEDAPLGADLEGFEVAAVDLASDRFGIDVEEFGGAFGAHGFGTGFVSHFSPANTSSA